VAWGEAVRCCAVCVQKTLHRTPAGAGSGCMVVEQEEAVLEWLNYGAGSMLARGVFAIQRPVARLARVARGSVGGKRVASGSRYAFTAKTVRYLNAATNVRASGWA